jgi:hypothetical protein
MSARQTAALGSASGLVLVMMCHLCIAAEQEPGLSAQSSVNPVLAEHTTSVTLGILSVKPLAVDRPWDPRVCIGCERNNGPSPRRAYDHRSR